MGKVMAGGNDVGTLPQATRRDFSGVDYDDPVVGDASSRVETSLVFPIQREARFGDLDDKRYRFGLIESRSTPRCIERPE